jgi:hypothetical protein
MSISLTLLQHMQEAVVWMTFPAAVGFPLWYQWRIHWQRSPVGQHIMAYSSVVALLYLTTLLQFTSIPVIVLMWLSLVLTVLLMVVVWWRVIIFVWIYRNSRKGRLNKPMIQMTEEAEDVSMGARDTD